MASIQERLENSSFTIKQKLYDNHIRLKGQEIKAIRIFATMDKYGDDETSSIISDNTITAYIDMLNLEIPLNRYRLDSIHGTVDSESIYLIEALPVDLYVKWADEVSTGDILVLLLKDRYDNLEIPVVWRVSDQTGRFQKNLLYKKFSIALWNPSNIDPDVRTLITNYIANN